MRSRTLAAIITASGTGSVLLMILAVVHRDLVMGQVAIMLAIICGVPISVWVIDLIGERRHEATVRRVLQVIGRADAEQEIRRIGHRG